jgi:hypothetical protein
MKRTTLAICFTIACSLVLYAQAPPQGQGSTGSERTGSMTLTGCLKAGADAKTFILTDVSGAGAETSRTETSQRTAPGELARTATSYKLTAASNLKLKDHVGHKVEVTGTLTKGMTHSSSTSSSNPSSSTSSTTTSGDPSKGDMAKLTVTSIKHVSPSCP